MKERTTVIYGDGQQEIHENVDRIDILDHGALRIAADDEQGKNATIYAAGVWKIAHSEAVS